MKITDAEKRSIKFYQGDVDSIVVDKENIHLKKFYKIPNAYEVLNTLLFYGITNEKSRVIENRFLNVKILKYMPEVLRVYEELYSAMCKYTFFYEQRNSIYSYRKDRMNSWDYLKEGSTYSFLSTSLNTKPTSNIFTKKEGILLLEIACHGRIEHLDVNEVLGEDNFYAEEKEVLFPPFLYFEEKEMELTSDEKKLLDKNNEPPKKKICLNITGSLIRTIEEHEYEEYLKEIEYIKEKILKKSAIKNARKVLRKLQKKQKPEEAMEQNYILWKKDIQLYLKMRFSIIKTQILNQRNARSRREVFEQELSEYIRLANSKREAYDKKMIGYSKVISFLQPCMVMTISISFLESVECLMKILSILFSTGIMITSGICKSETLEEKLAKWTSTFLRLDELQRDYLYHKECNDEELETYIKRFMKIIYADDIMCEQNIKKQIEHFEQITSQELE